MKSPSSLSARCPSLSRVAVLALSSLRPPPIVNVPVLPPPVVIVSALLAVVFISASLSDALLSRRRRWLSERLKRERHNGQVLQRVSYGARQVS